MEIFTRCPAEWKGSTKDTNRNSSGTPLVYSSVPCYLQGMHFFFLFCLMAGPLMLF